MSLFMISVLYYRIDLIQIICMCSTLRSKDPTHAAINCAVLDNEPISSTVNLTKKNYHCLFLLLIVCSLLTNTIWQNHERRQKPPQTYVCAIDSPVSPFAFILTYLGMCFSLNPPSLTQPIQTA